MSKRVMLTSHGITGVTGFSKQLWLQSRALIEEGYEVYVAHRDYRGEPILIPKGSGVTMQSGRPLDGYTMLPYANQPWGEDIIPWYMNKYKIDYLSTLGDIWCYQYIKNIPRQHGWKWLAHYVFDTENMVGFWNESLKAADISVVPSQNSYELCKKYGHENVQYVPHGINTEVFKPMTNDEKLKVREEYNLPKEAFVIGMVAHNQYRKQVHRLIEAFEMFVKKNPKSLLLLHCLPRDATGWDLPQLLKDRGIMGHVLFTDKAGKGTGDIHVPDSELRRFYCSMDVHALPTAGEGFGIPIVEAMACGIPNVVTDYTTTREFLCDVETMDDKIRVSNTRGIAVPYVDTELHHTGGRWAKINIPMMAEAFQFLKDNPEEGSKMGMKAAKFAQENYNEELVKKRWKEVYNNFDSLIVKDEDRSEMFSRLNLVRVG